MSSYHFYNWNCTYELNSRLNLFVTGGVTSLLPALAGLNKAREMLFFGDHYDADALLTLGIAWRVVDDDMLVK